MSKLFEEECRKRGVTPKQMRESLIQLFVMWIFQAILLIGVAIILIRLVKWVWYW